ncbi:NAD(+) diphosphatase [Microbacterium terrisoli]|jgi:NAD+ diphosphatase|uniref:NAD(+) diphosphatase n=1 Tax=Microbacterium terrisoli TaxID=3242192 RepID=UPI002803F4C6|nr:NAD(+) diphosphatase [Microbacterium protaetiae]
MTAQSREGRHNRSSGPAPAFGRSGFDRSAHERSDADLIARLRGDASTRTLVIRGDRAQLGADGGLRFRGGSDVADAAHWAFLGRASDGSAMLAAVLDPDAADLPDGPWVALRAAGAGLSAEEADAFVTAVALGRWLSDSTYCPACGAATRVQAAGWARRCDSCGREHFPRTDPAVIMAVESSGGPDRLLLGSNVLWGLNRFSCFAGFVEAGESAEAAVARELLEESGIQVSDVRYCSSQAWPYPRSLMLGFRARAVADDRARPDGDEIAALRWFTRAEIGEALQRGAWGDDAEGDDILLPGPASIAHRLIADWYAEAE